jgi:hypothetical protein
MLSKFTNHIFGGANQGGQLAQRMHQLNRAHIAVLQEMETLNQQLGALDHAEQMAHTLFDRHEDDAIARKYAEIVAQRAALEQAVQRQSARAAELMRQMVAVEEEITQGEMGSSQSTLLAKSKHQPEKVWG